MVALIIRGGSRGNQKPTRTKLIKCHEVEHERTGKAGENLKCMQLATRVACLAQSGRGGVVVCWARQHDVEAVAVLGRLVLHVLDDVPARKG